MYQIWHNSRQEGHDFDSFMTTVNKICEQHQRENRASAFAFILYDEFNPEIRNLLYDNTYWNSLDKISGKNITIFSIKVKERRRIKARTSNIPSDAVEYMTNLHSSQNLSDSNNQILNNLFGKEENIELPGLLFFQVFQSSIIDNFYIELKERNTESAFNEIKDYLVSCAKTISFITDDNRQNYKEIFHLLKQDLKNEKRLKSLTKRIPAIKNIGQLLGLIT